VSGYDRTYLAWRPIRYVLCSDSTSAAFTETCLVDDNFETYPVTASHESYFSHIIGTEPDQTFGNLLLPIALLGQDLLIPLKRATSRLKRAQISREEHQLLILRLLTLLFTLKLMDGLSLPDLDPILAYSLHDVWQRRLEHLMLVVRYYLRDFQFIGLDLTERKQLESCAFQICGFRTSGGWCLDSGFVACIVVIHKQS
jgi:hypothetical protein